MIQPDYMKTRVMTGTLAIELADSSHYDPVAAPQANARTAAFFKQQL